ncbi:MULTISPECIES: GNAT family N-acetyltransferase [unclassified Pseudoalteromonas]|uniref:GNAT family N-acetyltransferase n=1 Tax=unclassified Pseudoalteromonas TaxID=194690 RepID=UPI00051A03EF|nr:GNAT family N-acetyltransferase [Pseudoalteromonas sp. ND6B]KGK03096.1 GCN5-related N-acetyltransferase [Pseudoalteromonas sp. ND6B]
MNMCYQPTADLMASAQLTYTNMRGYYEYYGVDWQQLKICEQISDLENWDVLLNGDLVGAMRLAFDDEGCYIRDLQVDAAFQNMGIGAAAISECSRLAVHRGAMQLRLRVFKISPAHKLYTRSGFSIDKEDDRFYYMSKSLV